MSVLIIEPDEEIGLVWKKQVEALGSQVELVTTQEQATEYLRTADVKVVLLNLILGEGSAIALADFISFRHPNAKIVFVTDTTVFSDGSLFQHIPNACAFLQKDTPAADLAQIVMHHVGAGN